MVSNYYSEDEEIEMIMSELLFWAARNNVMEDIQLCLDEKVDVNLKEKETENTALRKPMLTFRQT